MPRDTVFESDVVPCETLSAHWLYFTAFLWIFVLAFCLAALELEPAAMEILMSKTTAVLSC